MEGGTEFDLKCLEPDYKPPEQAEAATAGKGADAAARKTADGVPQLE